MPRGQPKQNHAVAASPAKAGPGPSAIPPVVADIIIEEEDHCVVCAEPIDVRAVSPCGHNDVCVMCVARLRLLASNRKCLMCKADLEHVVATKQPSSTSYDGESPLLRAPNLLP